MKQLPKSLFSIIVMSMFFCAAPSVVRAEETIRINGSGSGLEMMRPLIDAYRKTQRRMTFVIEKPLGSSGAIKALAAGYLDIALTSKALKPEETAKGLKVRQYGQTPLAIVADSANTKKNISTKELEDIYAGATKKWPHGESVRPVLRPLEDSDTKILKGLSPGMAEAITKANQLRGMIIAVTDPESNEAVAKTPGSIGASGLTGVLSAQGKLKVLALNGMQPTPKNLANGSYPLAKEIHFVVTENLSAPAARFLDFVYSKKGRAIAEKAGVLVKPDAR